MSKNISQLKSFIAYCETHPEERFWQALRNWSQYSFIYGSNVGVDSNEVEDTFYKE